jgi:hypothetical protein
MAAIDTSSNPSLNDIVSSLAARVNKPYDVGLMAELKHIFNYKMKAAIYIWIEKNGRRDYFIQTIKMSTVRVPASECDEFPTDCYIVRTECQIPEPYRGPSIRSNEVFDYVGHISGYNAYAYAQRESLGLLKYKPYTAKAKKWFYSDKHVYIINEKLPLGEEGSVMIRGFFQDPLADYGCNVCDSEGNECHPDTAPYPAPPELLDQIITSILSVELRTGDLPKDQLLDKDKIKVDTVEILKHDNA